MCEFHDSNGNGFRDMWWTDKCIYFSSRPYRLYLSVECVYEDVMYESLTGNEFYQVGHPERIYYIILVCSTSLLNLQIPSRHYQMTNHVR